LPDLIPFIKQDAEVKFSKLPIHMPILARKLTDAAAIGDKLKEKNAVKCKEKVSKEKVSKLIESIATSFGFDSQKFSIDSIAPKLSGSFDKISLHGKSSAQATKIGFGTRYKKNL
jgi:hypothetical protein